jgi:hypothetical protein
LNRDLPQALYARRIPGRREGADVLGEDYQRSLAWRCLP